MPLIRIDVPEGTDTEKKKIIRAGYSSPKSKPSKKDRRKIAELQMNGDAYN